MDSILNAVRIIKDCGLISSVHSSEAKYLGCSGGDHIFGLDSGQLVAVDLVLGRVVRINGVAA